MSPVNKKKLYFIYNPQAGMAKIRENLSQILEIFANSGFEVTVCPTSKAGDARKAEGAHPCRPSGRRPSPQIPSPPRQHAARRHGNG